MGFFDNFVFLDYSIAQIVLALKADVIYAFIVIFFIIFLYILGNLSITFYL